MSESLFSGFTGRDMAVDLGTSNTLVYVRGRGIVLNEPSVVAVNVHDGTPLAVGVEAKRMIGRTPSHIQAIRPLKDGVIADFDVCEKMLRYFIQKVHNRRWARPRMVICVPSGITGVEQRAVQEAAEYAGARKPAYIIEEPMAAAIGAGLPVQEPTGNMIVDIGGGTTEVAVISLGGIVASQSVRIGGDELDQSIIQYIKKEYSLSLGERTAEEIKIKLGTAWPPDDELFAEVRGRDLITGLPKTVVVSGAEIAEAMEEPIAAVVDAVKLTLDKTPPELAADIMEQGIVLAGGGAMLRGLDERLAKETAMPILIATDPLKVVAIGSGAVARRVRCAQGCAVLVTEPVVSKGCGRPNRGAPPPTRIPAAPPSAPPRSFSDNAHPAGDHVGCADHGRLSRDGWSVARGSRYHPRCPGPGPIGRRAGLRSCRRRMERCVLLWRPRGREQPPAR